MTDIAPIPVVELRQWTYCRRIVYYHLFMAGAGKNTYKMTEGLRAQELIERLEMRRTLREYGLSDASREFGVWLTGAQTGLAGKVDLLLKSQDRAAVVDFKLTSGEPGENHRMQLAGYAALVEEVTGLSVPMTFLFRIPDNYIFPIPVTPAMRQDVAIAIEAIRRLRDSEMLPQPTSVRARCVECEYANYCADIW